MVSQSRESVSPSPYSCLQKEYCWWIFQRWCNRRGRYSMISLQYLPQDNPRENHLRFLTVQTLRSHSISHDSLKVSWQLQKFNEFFKYFSLKVHDSNSMTQFKDKQNGPLLPPQCPIGTIFLQTMSLKCWYHYFTTRFAKNIPDDEKGQLF